MAESPFVVFGKITKVEPVRNVEDIDVIDAPKNKPVFGALRLYDELLKRNWRFRVWSERLRTRIVGIYPFMGKHVFGFQNSFTISQESHVIDRIYDVYPNISRHRFPNILWNDRKYELFCEVFVGRDDIFQLDGANYNPRAFVGSEENLRIIYLSLKGFHLFRSCLGGLVRVDPSAQRAGAQNRGLQIHFSKLLINEVSSNTSSDKGKGCNDRPIFSEPYCFFLKKSESAVLYQPYRKWLFFGLLAILSIFFSKLSGNFIFYGFGYNI